MEWIKIIFLIGMPKIFLLGMATGQKNVITLNDGGYSNVLIAIDRKVPEDLTIIENIKTMFTSASQRLYNASRNHVYWKHIKILVPNTWSNLSRFEHSRTESLHSANIIVHHFPDDEPYVENLEGCGKGALSLMHLTPEYILNEQYREDEFGDTDNVLVRSWGYYRWGLFKENYDGKGVSNASYESGSKNDDPNSTGQSREGTRCSLEIKGNLSPSSCTTKQKKDCLFIPDTESEQTAKTSLLFATRKYHVPSISEFCDDGSHNIKAPNLMNNHCCGKSAWKVMTEHTTDFQHVHGEVERHSDITPVFEVLALSSVRSVVLVLDVSSSMLGCKLKRMIQSCKTYISTIPKGSKLGIVTFSTEAVIEAHLTDVKDITSREGLMNALPTNADCDTCIACGIQSAIKVKCKSGIENSFYDCVKYECKKKYQKFTLLI
ncbi:calcium-activated chloride channel regulator family member 3-like [Lytechinus pictus]|uniref:calcium-activated chloride channel regulator family member 3-like n=1 Tax=Lytechinus pictus TaxID=7653 RepID=UPI0030BA2367